MRKSISILGGDLRQCYLTKLLKSDGWNVTAWGLEQGGADGLVPFGKAVCSDILVLPLPVCREGKLFLPLTDTKLPINELWSRVQKEQLLLGGAVGTLKESVLESFGLELIDYYDRETVQVAGAIPTAEGAIMRMMEETPYTVHGSKCLVVGYGRIGKSLAHRLQALGAVVTVAARKPSDLAWIRACGCRAVIMSELTEKSGEYDVIFNTVPSKVIDSSILSVQRKDCLLMELASAPGGFYDDAVKETGLRAVVERGLPGKAAPETAAKIIRDGIYEVLRESGEEV